METTKRFFADLVFMLNAVFTAVLSAATTVGLVLWLVIIFTNKTNIPDQLLVIFGQPYSNIFYAFFASILNTFLTTRYRAKNNYDLVLYLGGPLLVLEILFIYIATINW